MEDNAENLTEENTEYWLAEEQEFLERLSNFGEGYFDFASFQEIFGESGETGLAGA